MLASAHCRSISRLTGGDLSLEQTWIKIKSARCLNMLGIQLVQEFEDVKILALKWKSTVMDLASSFPHPAILDVFECTIWRPKGTWFVSAPRLSIEISYTAHASFGSESLVT